MDKSKSRILTALFDVRPVNKWGDLDIGKIEKIKTVLDLRKGKTKRENEQRKKAVKFESKDLSKPEKLPIEELPTKEEILAELNAIEEIETLPEREQIKQPITPMEDFYFPEVAVQDYPQIKIPNKQIPKKTTKKGFLVFLITGLLISLIIPGVAWVGQSLAIKEDVLGSGLSAYQSLLATKDALEQNESTLKILEKIPLVREMFEKFLDYPNAFLKILGQDNPKSYLLLFQNNSEMRATGGFIGTYGLLTLDKGEIKKLSIKGIFDADGQLREKIIPPRPIQKISTAWSMHDANWFADFPTSAEKVAWFYEKTGGPTVDGVISFTPTVIERLMKLTGSVFMPNYGLTLTPENFVELIQYQVEVDYDQELNQPKKILADLAPLFIERLGQLSSPKRKEALEIIFDCLKEKHILIYFRDSSLEKLSVEEGWSGQLLKTDKDYLSVVSSNICGYKTDRVIEESIQHQTEIQPDGSIIDTLTIKRHHQGGHFEYDWWNRVNADYLRVYLPLGSQLLSACGQTIEAYQPPVDYQKQGFKADPLVNSIENKMIVDPKTGTHIFEENNKTVFANWLYVSPGKTATLTYQYKLPFKIDLTKSTDSYSLLIQKQSGSLASQFKHQLKFPADWRISWQYPDNLDFNDLRVDRFLGATFEF